MNNMLFLHQGCWVVEIGYIGSPENGGKPLPSDYVCLARNLGHKYFLSIAVSGGYGSPLVADLEDIRAVALQYKQFVDI